jgi:hypothetical protein
LAAVLDVPVAAVLVLFFTCFLVLFAVLLAAGLVVLEAAGAVACVRANIRGMEATVNAIASKVVFIFSLPAGSPAYSSIVRRNGGEFDSLRRLWKTPNSGLRRLRFISVRN